MSSQRTSVMERPTIVVRAPEIRAASPKHRVAVAAVSGYGLCLTAGLVLIVVAYDMARHSVSHTHFAVFWAGFAAVLAATAWAGARGTRGLRLTALALYAGITFVPKLLMSWSGPTDFDEFGHLRHVSDMLHTGRLDVHSAYLPIVQWYPGLEVATAALHRLTHVSVWHAGQLIVACAHAVALFAIWRLAVALGLSERQGFAAAVVYSLNPGFLYFDTQFAYESLGLPLALVAATCAVFSRRAESKGRAVGWGCAALVVVLAVIPTHHLSALVMAAMLVALAVFVPAQPGRPAGVAAEVLPWVATVVGVLGVTIWFTLVAPTTVSYLQPHIDGVLSQVGAIVSRGAGSGRTRAPFGANSDLPSYEVISSFVAQVVAGVVTVGALVQAWLERRDWHRSLMLVPSLLLTAAYFGSLPIALTGAGGESAHRIWPFTYVGIALVAAWGWPLWRSLLGRINRRLAVGLVALAAMSVAVGNVAAGENVYYRFPGPHAFGTDTRSQTGELRSVAAWADAHLPSGSKVVTDRFTSEILTGYTRLLTQTPNESYATTIYREGDDASANLREYLRSHGFRYWLVDMRILTMKPVQRFFQGYSGADSVSSVAVATAGSTSFLRLLLATDHYRIYEIRS